MAATQELELRSVISPKQARSEQTLTRLLDAAQELIEERGYGELSIPDVVARAKSSVGGFYARFRNKDELLCALEERHLAEMRRMLDDLTNTDALGSATLAEVVGPAIRELVKINRRHARLLAAFVAATASKPEHRERVRAFGVEIVARFGQLLRDRRAEIHHPQPERAIDFVIQMVLSGARQEAVFGNTRAGGKKLSEKQMASELERMCLAYLGVDV